MALIRDIVFSKQQPFDRNCLWISPDGMYVYNKGKWTCVVEADLNAIRNTIADEVARAVEAEETNADAIATETTRATEAEEALSQAIIDAVESIISNLEYSDSYETGLFVGNVTCTDGSLSIEKKALSLVWDSDSKTLSLSDGTTTFGSIDATAFVVDGMLDSATYDSETKSLIFVFNTDSGKETVTVDVSDLVDIYKAGDGLILSDNEFSVVIDADSESFLTVSSSGVKLSGVQDAIDSAASTLTDALNAEIERATASETDLQEAIDNNTALIINAHASVSLAASKTIIEKGVSTSVTFTGTASFNSSTELVEEMDIYASSSASGTAVATASTSPVTYTVSLSDSVTYSLLAVIGGVSKTATRTVNAYYPIYMVASADIPTSSTVTTGTKQSISSTAAGSRSITTSEGDYVWLCVPAGVTVPSSATMSGFDCPIQTEGTVTVTVNSASVSYTLVRTTNAMKADTLTIVYA